MILFGYKKATQTLHQEIALDEAKAKAKSEENGSKETIISSNPYQDLKFFTIASRKHANPKEAQFDGNIDFWASIEITRQCSGLVMHPGSAVGRFIASAVCYMNNYRYLQCPDIFEISGGQINFGKGETM